ncbi:MAG TPA: putative toxin-antitoxin system toxin component, PIN family [Thermoanaerobaculia bacterium]|nr:putative toxin-antitoxin system toxin component, PIN family [Thermoanaerobaculia bacterium]
MTGPFVVDTNVVVAGLLTADPAAPTARLLDAMLAGRLPFVLSVELLTEYGQVLLRPRIAARHGLSPEEIDEILIDLAANGRILESESLASPTFPRGDGHLESLLAASPGTLLVTGDERTRAAAGTRAVTPAAAWQRVSAERR